MTSEKTRLTIVVLVLLLVYLILDGWQPKAKKKLIDIFAPFENLREGTGS